MNTFLHMHVKYHHLYLSIHKSNFHFIGRRIDYKVIYCVALFYMITKPRTIDLIKICASDKHIL